MNKQSPLYKALEERGRSRRLPPDFSFEIMNEIRALEKRRKRRDMWWGIAGYAVAAFVAIFTLVYFFGDMFNETLHTSAATFAASKVSTVQTTNEMIKSFEASWSSSADMLTSLLPVSAILLVLDHYLRKKIAVRYKRQ